MYLNPRHFGSVRRGIDGRRQSCLRKEMQLSGWDSPLLVQKFSRFSVESCCVYLTTET
jgi:hypothetical protein